jgi:immune inhibitor A
MTRLLKSIFSNRPVRFRVGWLSLWMVCLVASSHAMPPHPEVIQQTGVGKVNPPYYMLHAQQARAQGLNAGGALGENLSPALAPTGAGSTSGETRLLAILVDFSDKVAQVQPEFFDSLLFDTVGRTVHTYFEEVSYGTMNIIPGLKASEIGWVRAPNPYSFYVDGRNGIGGYPRNTKKLVEDVVAAIDDLVDFSVYDNNGDGSVDGLVIIHAGRGAERSGSSDDIWSHQWYITPQERDGVRISKYSIQPEYISYPGDGTIGVFCHELGHLLLGLPDLYDTDYTSRGVGDWCLMSFGAWLGPFGKGESPAHLNAWCKARAGFVTPALIDSSYTQFAITQVQTSGEVLKLAMQGTSTQEYFLVENRQRIGFDRYLPGDGLLIWHVDESKTVNTQEWRPGSDPVFHALCALEQADGDYDLERNLNSGDGWDPYPGIRGATAFYELTDPSSNSYLNGPSGVSIFNISASGETMHADISATLVTAEDTSGSGSSDGLPQTIALSQNYPNPFNPSTTITYTLSRESDITLSIFDITGRRVITLVDGTVSEGQHTAQWEGTDSYGKPVASGIYFYRVESGEQTQVKKMMLIK